MPSTVRSGQAAARAQNLPAERRSRLGTEHLIGRAGDNCLGVDAEEVGEGCAECAIRYAIQRRRCRRIG